MKTIDLNAGTPSARELVEHACDGPVLVRGDQGRTYLVAEIDDADIEAVKLGDSSQLLAIVQRSRERAESEGWLTTDQLRERLDL